MKYVELPNWAKAEAYETVERWYLEHLEEAREAGEDVKDYTEEELNDCVMIYLMDIDSFVIEYDEDDIDMRYPSLEW